MEQVWFPGAHGDVGGGYPESTMANGALQWMLNRVREAGLELDAKVVRALPLSYNACGLLHDSRTKFYRLLREQHRTIGGDRTIQTEFFHRSVVERWAADPTYRPPSLAPHASRLDEFACSLSTADLEVFSVQRTDAGGLTTS
jgi:hypothetical protein